MSISRTIKREMIRSEARRKKYSKPNRYLMYIWNELQIKLRGVDKRSINMSRGTHPKRLWKSRCLIAESIKDRQREIGKKIGRKV